MKVKHFGIILVISTLLFSCSGNNFVNRLKKDKNIEEIIAFKIHLYRINLMNDFKEYSINNYPKDDIVIKNFIRKYDIKSIYVNPCLNKYYNLQPYYFFKNCGNFVELRSGIPLISTEHTLIFDYSDEGLKLKDGIDEKKVRIAERIFVF